MAGNRVEIGQEVAPKTRKKRERRKTSKEVIAYGVHVPPLPEPAIALTPPELDAPLPTEYPLTRVQTALQKQADATGEKAGGVELPVVEAPANVEGADFAVAVHRLAKPLRKAPGAIAAELADNFNASDGIPLVKRAEATPTGYLNFELDTDAIGNATLQTVELLGDRYGHENVGNGAKVIIDGSSPNVAKYMSVGHLRSTVNAESLARIYRAAGYDVIRDNHLGDWGTQFGMLGRAKELWGAEIDEQMPDADPVQKLYRLYVRMNDEIAAEKAAHPDGESTLEKEGREWFARLEGGDPQALELLRETTAQSIQEFQRVYELLGSQYEYYLGESFYVPMLADVVSAYEKKGTTVQDDRGVTSIRLAGEHSVKLRDGTNVMRPNVLPILKSDGTSLYATRDLAALVARTAWFNPERILYVVGGEQKDYFKQVFEAFDTLAEGKGPKLDHVSFGMVTLPEGKMSTRKGRVIFLEEVLTEAITRAKEKITEIDRGLTPDEINTIARQVGVGAVIYMDLGQSRDRNIQFSWDQALSMEGNSAPYIQYTQARAQSILRKAEAAGIAIDTTQEAEFTLPQEVALVKNLAKLNTAISDAIAKNEPSIIAAYTYKAADLFSQFYDARDAQGQKINILNDTDAKRRNDRLRLTAAAAQVIRNGLYLLGIEAPEKM